MPYWNRGLKGGDGARQRSAGRGLQVDESWLPDVSRQTGFYPKCNGSHGYEVAGSRRRMASYICIADKPLVMFQFGPKWAFSIFIC